ncbi:SprT family zinc-dependent metalloprotease [Clostridium acetobutylicum]|uniref:Predicted metal-dependent hydrolase n=4 Tax=Clostridiaceae TaxID=31979 RepID=Q97M70_CLOAB|nr:SprT family zinc-dependent metalloprotease [Clostridium acetobutylicum]AAK78309.1 Predicted metal-dependent hydrolase [Clostridium acetobutylicum ATCC 824]ADZ19378.1 metal-dependent hydrolase [Clostridium acetobutylicum EA 2018]AEI31172.1 metal-dependent hydrolase [Clostridium acetobutylicum DSM 1731]PSM05837.1 M48 family peptidase [Clostridium sp. NJ4]AWV80034.1 M48 family peptidase [Clostridium acetobutylicum]
MGGINDNLVRFVYKYKIKMKRERSAMNIEYMNQKVEFSLVRKERKSIKISVNRDFTIEVIAPFNVAEEEIKNVVYKKMKWIIKQMKRMENIIDINEEIKYSDGDAFYIFGTPYRLIVKKGIKNKMRIFGENVYMYIKEKDNYEYKKNYAEKWYKKIAAIELEYLYNEKYKIFDEIYDEKPKLCIRKMKSKWGSYSPADNKVVLNTQLVKIPKTCIEYVIIHELCHVKFRNHRKEFYNYVNNFMPDWKLKKESLDRYVNV